MGLTVGLELSTGERVVEVRRGGFGEVGILEDELEGNKAVKRINDEILEQVGETVSPLFFQECRITAGRLHDAPFTAAARLALKELDGLGPVLFMTYVDGPSLSRLLRSGRQSLSQAMRMGGQIATAIAFAHDRDIRHRDLKPSNILLTRTNEIRVIDWGLSRAHDAAGLTVGVVDYLSPERRAFPGTDTEADDVYALGVVLYECLTGGLPPEHHTIAGTRRSVWEAHPLAPEELVEVVTAAMAEKPAERPTAARIADVLCDGRLTEEVAAREVELPFCRACGFVLTRRITACPICGGRTHERVARPPAKGMVRVPAGVFVHGLDANQAQNALLAAGLPTDDRSIAQLAPKDDPPRPVFVPGFDIDVTPVTNEAYARFVEATNYPTPDGFLAATSGLPNHPVVHVSWKDALCYALWAGKRLPTALEWEKAARGDEDDRTYPWGPVWQPDRCNHNRRFDFRYTSPVNAFVSGAADGRSPFGVADMAGNVREWTSGGGHPDMRALCGGGWSDNVALDGIVSMRVDAAIDYESKATGFRCAADIVYEERPIDDDPAAG